MDSLLQSEPVVDRAAGAVDSLPIEAAPAVPRVTFSAVLVWILIGIGLGVFWREIAGFIVRLIWR